MAALEDGHEYVLINARAGTAMSLGEGGPDQDGHVVGWEWERRKGNARQIWKIQFAEKDSKGYQWCTITNRSPSVILTLPKGSSRDGTPLFGHEQTSSHDQQWLFSKVPGGNFTSYLIYSRVLHESGDGWHCVDLERGIERNGTTVQAWKAGPLGWNPNQVWILVKVN